MRRFLIASPLTLATFLSLSLLVLWPVSYRLGVSLGLPKRYAMIGMNNGALVYWSSDVQNAPVWETYDAKSEPMTAQWIEGETGKPFLFRWGSLAYGHWQSETVAVVPIWVGGLLFALPIIWQWRQRRKRDSGKGFEVIQSG
jgi:hypothetical protein